VSDCRVGSVPVSGWIVWGTAAGLVALPTALCTTEFAFSVTAEPAMLAASELMEEAVAASSAASVPAAGLAVMIPFS
jgi:uncharacterized transporter YbjL